MTNFQKLFLLISAILVLSISYYLVVFLPRKEERKNLIDTVNRKLRSSCIKDADNFYQKEWNDNCEILQLDVDCKLPSYTIDFLEKRYQQAKNDCYKRYPEK